MNAFCLCMRERLDRATALVTSLLDESCWLFVPSGGTNLYTVVGLIFWISVCMDVYAFGVLLRGQFKLDFDVYAF